MHSGSDSSFSVNTVILFGSETAGFSVISSDLLLFLSSVSTVSDSEILSDKQTVHAVRVVVLLRVSFFDFVFN